MVEQKKGRQASRQAAAENNIPRGKAQERRKGYFYLWLAAWWPTVAGRKRLTRKGVERRLRALLRRKSVKVECKATHGKHTQNAQ